VLHVVNAERESKSFEVRVLGLFSKPYLGQAGRSPLFSLLQRKRRGVDSAAGAGAGRENKL
ncbi:hypothetical protein QUA74_11260, partial [Microcoleus sp. LAD1_D3]|uniref:hypothetical protein n=1 Tax=Microcoleus sp. LAD1_D3 TaxID=2819365 RepID=UPI002FD16207